MNFHLLWTIAKYETLALQRSWFFRIFAAISVGGIGIFNIAVYVPQSNSPWIYKALGASIPYANLILLNLGQAVVAIFLASEFLKQDQKNDTVEVIYVRPMSNTIYVLGKTLGILLVFAILNLVILALGIGFSFIHSESSKDILALFIYPLLISLPTLVFIIGLSFALMVLFKNQAVTFILLLGYIAVTIFYLNQKVYHAFDYIAYKVPMMYSSFTGFGNFSEILLHRGIYLLLGIGLIFFTIYKLNRLPQNEKHTHWPVITFIFFMVAGAATLAGYIHMKMSRELLRERVIEKNNQYPDKNGFTLTKCDLNLTHLGEEIDVVAKLELENKGNKHLDTLIFSLNPSLQVKRIHCEGKERDFVRDLHLIKIPANPAMKPGDSWNIEVAYHGSINEDIGFVDLDKDEYSDNYSSEMFTIRKRVAYCTRGFVCLTSSINWYPVPGAGYSTKKPFSKEVDFTTFNLRVKTSPGLVAVSQGKLENVSEGEFIFSPEFPLPQLSLVIGDYLKKSVLVDSVEYCIYTKKGNDFYSKHLKDIKDTVGNIVKSLADEYHLKTKLNYPYRRFSLVEVPVHFSPDIHKWASTSDAVQPEMIFYREKGVNLDFTDLKRFLRNEENEMKKQGKEVLPAEIQTQLVKKFTTRNLFENRTYNIFPQFYSYVTNISSEKWPVLNFAFETYFQDKIKEEKSKDNFNYKINLELQESSLAAILTKDIQNQYEADIQYDVVVAKSKFLFNALKSQFRENAFDSLLTEFIRQHKFQSFTIKKLDSAIHKSLGRSIENDLDSWYSSKKLAGYLVKDVNLYKLQKDEKSFYQVVFKIANVNNANGFISSSLSIGKEDKWPGDKVFIPALTAKELSITLDQLPLNLVINTWIAENLPNEISINLRDTKPMEINKPFETVGDCKLFTSLEESNEIVVDNEAEGFSVIQNINTGFLKQMIDKDRKSEDKYKNLNRYNPSEAWTPTLDPNYYGEFIHSAYYIASGQEEKEAIWQTKIIDPGYYDIYFYAPKFIRFRSRKMIDYNITIHHDGGIDKIRRFENEFGTGWSYLGTYYISTDSAKVALSNKSDGEIIIADAVKWVKK